MEIVVSEIQARVPVTVIQLEGRLDASTKDEFEARAWEAIVKGGAKDMLVDLSGVSYMSSAGLRALNLLHKLLHPDRDRNGLIAGEKSPHLVLVGAVPRVKQIIVMAGFDSFFEMCETRDEALARF